MRKIVVLSFIASSVLFAQSDLKLSYVVTDYDNSKTKIDGTGYEVGLSHDFGVGVLGFGYEDSAVDRIGTNPTLEVQKVNLNYSHKLSKELGAKVSYLKIDDNIAPTDDGKVYGFGVGYAIAEGFALTTDLYKSDYKQFNVSQVDITLAKNFMMGDIKSKAIVGVKKIDIDGDKYNAYTFKDKDYTTSLVALSTNYNGYTANIGTMFGKRLFAVLENGAKVQHHAVEQDKTYFVGFGKKIGNFDVMAKYSYQNGIELPENRKDVDTKTSSVTLTYKF